MLRFLDVLLAMTKATLRTSFRLLNAHFATGGSKRSTELTLLYATLRRCVVRDSAVRASERPKEPAGRTTERSEGALRGPTRKPANEVTLKSGRLPPAARELKHRSF